MTIEGRPQPTRIEDTPTIFSRFVSVDYFRTLGVRVARGRDFSTADRANTAAVAIVNETTAKRHWPEQDPLGQRFRLDDDRGTAIEIVGVVADVKHFGLTRSPEPEVFMPLPQATPLHWQWLQRSMIAIARTSGESESAAGAIRQAVRTLDDQLPVYNLRSMEQLRNESTGDERVGLALVGIFAIVALALASVGVYGVMAVMVAGRSREIGIRLALGARPHDVRWMIVRDGAALTAVGVVIGIDRGVRTHEADAGAAFRDAANRSRDILDRRRGRRDRGDTRLLGPGASVNPRRSSHRAPRGVRPPRPGSG